MAELVERCGELLDRLAHGSAADALLPGECLELWSNLGELSFGAWAEQLMQPGEERRLMIVEDLRQRAHQAAITERLHVASCLEEGIRECAREVLNSVKVADRTHARGGVGSFITSYEFIHDVLRPRDRLGYALELSQTLGPGISVTTHRQIRSLDGVLHEELPKLLVEFDKAGDFPSSNPDRFPTSFWWRRTQLQRERTGDPQGISQG